MEAEQSFNDWYDNHLHSIANDIAEQMRQKDEVFNVRGLHIYQAIVECMNFVEPEPTSNEEDMHEAEKDAEDATKIYI